jgi:hypothetical protein
MIESENGGDIVERGIRRQKTNKKKRILALWQIN